MVASRVMVRGQSSQTLGFGDAAQEQQVIVLMCRIDVELRGDHARSFQYGGRGERCSADVSRGRRFGEVSGLSKGGEALALQHGREAATRTSKTQFRDRATSSRLQQVGLDVKSLDISNLSWLILCLSEVSSRALEGSQAVGRSILLCTPGTGCSSHPIHADRFSCWTCGIYLQLTIVMA
jgi:hypothetical protein